MRTAWCLWVATALAIAAPTIARAQDYPSKPVLFVVPYPPGGTTDYMARLIGRKLEQKLGKPLIIENRPGAASVLGAAFTAKSPPDGYTLLLATSTTMAINVSIYKHLPYDPVRDLAPVALVAGIPFLLVVNPALPVHSVGDLIRLARDTPGGLAYASNGHGGAGHLDAELMKSMTGIQLTHIPYKGLAPALNDVVAGHVPMMFGDFSSALRLVREGRLRALGVSTAERIPAAPEIPTLAEAGLPGYEASSWQMVVAPSGVPDAILTRLNHEIRDIIATAEVQKDFADKGILPIASPSPYALTGYVKDEIVRWGKVVEQAGAAGSQ